MPVTINEDAGRVTAEEFFVSSGSVTRGTFTDADNGTLVVGGPLDVNRVRVSVSFGGIEHRRFRLSQALLRMGGHGDDGDIQLYASDNTDMANPTGSARVHLNGSSGGVTLSNATGPTLTLSGSNGDINAGGNGVDGDLTLRAGDGDIAVRIDGGGANVYIGGSGRDGDLVLYPASAPITTDVAEATVHLDGDAAALTLGRSGQGGDLTLRASDGDVAVRIDGDGANVFIGGGGRDGDIVLYPASAPVTTDTALATIHLNGDSGDIILRNADCAEEFSVTDRTAAEPGSVMVLSDSGALAPSETAYDRRAVGVVSGAGAYAPGIVLDKQPGATDRRPIALVGKVCVRVSDEGGPVRVGDLLTTSSTPGHAMRAADPSRAFGAVIGKALAAHETGCGLIPMIVALQ